MIRIAALLFSFLLPLAAAAAPVSYRLDRDRSNVGFEVDFGSEIISGTMPVETADIALDFDRPDQSTVAVTLNAAGAVANFPFATQALVGPRVLDTDRTPEIAFRSTAFRVQPAPGARAEVDGLLTIRGTTRPVTLAAEIFRQQGQDEGDRSALSVHLDARVSRAAFDADGWADLVGDEVRIQIVARIDRDR